MTKAQALKRGSKFELIMVMTQDEFYSMTDTELEAATRNLRGLFVDDKYSENLRNAERADLKLENDPDLKNKLFELASNVERLESIIREASISQDGLERAQRLRVEMVVRYKEPLYQAHLLFPSYNLVTKSA